MRLILPVLGCLAAVLAQAAPMPPAPSTLPGIDRGAGRYRHPYGVVLLFDGYAAVDDRAPLAPCRPRAAEADDGRIDWCALAPYQLRYEPQLPVPWRRQPSW